MLITGATSGIGLEITRALAESSHHLVLVGRSEEKLSRLVAELEERGAKSTIETALCDLSSQASIRSLSADIRAKHERIDVLVNCAGVYQSKRRESVDGIELVFATNVLGYHLLTMELLPLLEAGAPARVVVVASEFAGSLDLDDIPLQNRRYKATASYQRTKQANRMWTRALSRRVEAKGISVNSMSPGFVYTGLYDDVPFWMRPIMKMVGRRVGRTAAEGAATAVWLAEGGEIGTQSGGFYIDNERRPCEFEDVALEERLFAECERLTQRA